MPKVFIGHHLWSPCLEEKGLTVPFSAAALKFITSANCFEASDLAANGKYISR